MCLFSLSFHCISLFSIAYSLSLFFIAYSYNWIPNYELVHQIICVYYKCLLSTKYDKGDNQSNYYTNTSIITIYCFDCYIFQTKYVLNEIFFYFPANSYLPRKYFLKVISSSLYEYFRMKYCFTYKLRNISNHMHFYFYKYFCGQYNPLPESIYIYQISIL